jgi:uncharacterized protein (DUF433 family)
MSAIFTPNETLDLFEDWKAGLVSNPDILGGEMVFPQSRLSVLRIVDSPRNKLTGIQ